MTIAAISIAIVGLMMCGLIYWRARRRRELRKFIAAEEMKRAGVGDWPAENQQQVGATSIATQLDTVAERIEGNARAAGTATLTAAHHAQEALTQQVHQMKVRTMLLLAEAKAKSAREAVMDQRLVEAEKLLIDSAELTRRSLAGLTPEAYDRENLERVARASREAAVSLRVQAESTARKMDQLLAENGRWLERAAWGGHGPEDRPEWQNRSAPGADVAGVGQRAEDK